MKVESVNSDNGAAINYTTSTSNDNLVLKIGDVATYEHGSTTYVITYTAKSGNETVVAGKSSRGGIIA